jgi:hypothetical protein
VRQDSGQIAQEIGQLPVYDPAADDDVRCRLAHQSVQSTDVLRLIRNVGDVPSMS